MSVNRMIKDSSGIILGVSLILIFNILMIDYNNWLLVFWITDDENINDRSNDPWY